MTEQNGDEALFEAMAKLLLSKADRWERTATDLVAGSTDDFRRGYASCAKNLASDVRETTHTMLDIYREKRRVERQQTPTPDRETP